MVEQYWSGWKKGGYTAPVPAQSAARGALYRHVPWPTPTLPLVTVAFRAPAFSDTDRDGAALSMLLEPGFREGRNWANWPAGACRRTTSRPRATT